MKSFSVLPVPWILTWSHLSFVILTWTFYPTYKWQSVDDALNQYEVFCSTNFCSNILNRAVYSISCHLCFFMSWILICFKCWFSFSVLDCYDLQAFIYYLISCYLVELYLCFYRGDFAICVLYIFSYCIALMEVLEFCCLLLYMTYLWYFINSEFLFKNTVRPVKNVSLIICIENVWIS